MQPLVVEAEPRDGRGKNAARQLRRAGRVPAVVYGGKGEPLALSVDPRLVEKILHSEAGQNAVFQLTVKGHGKTQAMIRDTQLHPVVGRLLHVDFLRVAMDVRIKVKVPVEVKGEASGVKQQGGILELVQREVEVECLPGDIPDHFLVDVSSLAINQSIRVGDLTVDNHKIKVLTDGDRMIAHVVPPKAEEEKPAEEVVAVAAPEAAEPEVIRKGKAEAEGEEGEEAPGGGAEGKPESGKKK